MTINQVLDKLTDGKPLTTDQESLKVSLLSKKMKEGGRTKVEDEKAVKEILDQEVELPNEDL